MNRETTAKVIENIRCLLQAVASDLPPDNIRDADELLDHDEWGLAFDLICTQLHEYGVIISEASYAMIEETGVMLESDAQGWSNLKQQVVKNGLSGER